MNYCKWIVLFSDSFLCMISSNTGFDCHVTFNIRVWNRHHVHNCSLYVVIHTVFIGTFVICPYTKFHMSVISVPLDIAIRPYAANMLSYLPQKILDSCSHLWNLHHCFVDVTEEIRIAEVSWLLVLWMSVDISICIGHSGAKQFPFFSNLPQELFLYLLPLFPPFCLV